MIISLYPPDERHLPPGVQTRFTACGAQVQVGAPHHLAPASEHSAAGVLLVLLLPDQGEVQVHVLCHLPYQVQAGILPATLSRGISNLNIKSGLHAPSRYHGYTRLLVLAHQLGL